MDTQSSRRAKRVCNINIDICFVCHCAVNNQNNLHIKCLNNSCNNIKHLFCTRKPFCCKACKNKRDNSEQHSDNINVLLIGDKIEDRNSDNMENNCVQFINIQNDIQSAMPSSTSLSKFVFNNNSVDYLKSCASKNPIKIDAHAKGPIHQSSHCVDTNMTARITTVFAKDSNGNVVRNNDICFQGQANFSAGLHNMLNMSNCNTNKPFVTNLDFELIGNMANQIDELNNIVSTLKAESRQLKEENEFLTTKLIELNNHVVLIVTNINDSLGQASNEFKKINDSIEMNTKIEKKLEHNISAMNSQIHVLTSYVLRNCRKINEVRYDLLKSKSEVTIDLDDVDDAIKDFFVCDQDNNVEGKFKNNGASTQNTEKNDDNRNVIYVGRLPHYFSEQALKNLITMHFGAYGQIEELFINTKRNFAFVKFKNASDASTAVKKMHGFIVNNRRLKCDFSRLQVIPQKNINYANASNNKRDNENFQKAYRQKSRQKNTIYPNFETQNINSKNKDAHFVQPKQQTSSKNYRRDHESQFQYKNRFFYRNQQPINNHYRQSFSNHYRRDSIPKNSHHYQMNTNTNTRFNTNTNMNQWNHYRSFKKYQDHKRTVNGPNHYKNVQDQECMTNMNRMNQMNYPFKNSYGQQKESKMNQMNQYPFNYQQHR